MPNLDYRLIPLSRLEGLVNNSKKHSTDSTLASINLHGFRDPIQVDLVFLPPQYDGLTVDEILADKTIKLTLVEGHDRALNCLKTLFKQDRDNPPAGISKAFNAKGDKVNDWLVPATVTRSESHAAAVAYSIDHNATTAKALGDQAVFDLFNSDLLAAQSDYLLSNNFSDLACFDDLATIYHQNNDYSVQDNSSYSSDNDSGLNGLGQNDQDNLGQNGQDDQDFKVLENRCKPGDLWAIGDHRLIIGDCLDSAVWAKLLGDKKVDIIFTSPPYASQREYDQDSGFKPIPAGEYIDWFKNVQHNIKLWLKNTGSYFLNIKEHCENGQRHLYVKKLTISHVESWGWCFVDEFIWRDTRNGVPAGFKNRFKDAWEPVFHFTKSTGETIKFNPLANGTHSDHLFDSSGLKPSGTGSGLFSHESTEYKSGIARPSNVVELPASSKGYHCAAFPHKLPEWFIKAFSDEGDLVVDCFAGSGSTILAAANNNRLGYGIELSPSYGDIVLSRLEDALGLTAIKL